MEEGCARNPGDRSLSRPGNSRAQRADRRRLYTVGVIVVLAGILLAAGLAGRQRFARRPSSGIDALALAREAQAAAEQIADPARRDEVLLPVAGALAFAGEIDAAQVQIEALSSPKRALAAYLLAMALGASGRGKEIPSRTGSSRLPPGNSSWALSPMHSPVESGSTKPSMSSR